MRQSPTILTLPTLAVETFRRHGLVLPNVTPAAR